MDLPGSGDNRLGLGTRPAVEKDMRFLRSVHRRLPHRSHCCSLRHRQHPLHLLSDHREPGADSPGASSKDAGLGLRLRHLPRCLPREPERSCCGLLRLGTRCQRRDSGRKVGHVGPCRSAAAYRGGVSTKVPGHTDTKSQTRGVAEKRMCGPGKLGRPVCCPSFKQGFVSRFAIGPEPRLLGLRSDWNC